MSLKCIPVFLAACFNFYFIAKYIVRRVAFSFAKRPFFLTNGTFAWSICLVVAQSSYPYWSGYSVQMSFILTKVTIAWSACLIAICPAIVSCPLDHFHTELSCLFVLSPVTHAGLVTLYKSAAWSVSSVVIKITYNAGLVGLPTFCFIVGGFLLSCP